MKNALDGAGGKKLLYTDDVSHERVLEAVKSSYKNKTRESLNVEGKHINF